MSTWREERRADRLTEAQIRREEAAAAAQVRIHERAAAAHQAREDRAEAAAQELAAQQARQDRRDAAWGAVRGWATENVVDVLIYPAVLLAFVMSAPSMAAYGHGVYRSWLGALLPGISELLMFAFAVAVLVSRRRTPGRPVWALQAGVFVFAAVSAGLNFLHGLTQGWSAGVVMAVVAVSGITAHQLTLASPPRSRAERAEARIGRAAAAKVARARRAAVRQAVAEIAVDGSARLVYAPGRYTLTRFGRLEKATVPGLPVGDPASDWDAALAELTAGGVDPTDPAEPTDTDVDGCRSTGTEPEGSGPLGSSAVATLDPGPDVHESTPDRPVIDRKPGRSMEQLRAELAAAIEAGTVNPDSAESIRRTLRCSAARARELRNDHTRRDREGGSK